MDAATSRRLLSLSSLFLMEGRALGVEPLGSGLINDTFLVRSSGPEDYVLQRINDSVFRYVPLLQSNIAAVTGHLRAKLLSAGVEDAGRRVLRFLEAADGSGNSFVRDENGGWWRMSVFIRGSVTRDALDAAGAEAAGLAFGGFEEQLSDLPATLGETIPHFHDIEFRLEGFRSSLARDAAGRTGEIDAAGLAEGILRYADEMSLCGRLHREGKLPKRICHCDPKLNNILFDASGGGILCVIDLDTVMPSFVFSDFGDFLRTAANSLPEDSPEFSGIDFCMDVFRPFASGYLKAATFLTPAEKENLPYAACLFPYMQAVRFLADYLDGDVYYRTSYPGHNLVRARNQWALFLSARSKLSEMQDFINEYNG